ncbi:MAG: bifunctional (p)ppGpp synthetase/guanosine-3',5'-bis(diphosphate) 3'-pyrophosphohydrolase [Bacteroidales bacterium]|nr:bifunctional (p)ppGpp synthetase/guanosine-3',5'-bis(diphosphate) 3'-pyrophosphohydrolase [Bacteroidales bacterium]
MSNAAADTSLLDKAIRFATEAHSGTERRGKGYPYIVHPLEAVAIVASITPNQELLAAAALHDTVEDTDVTVDLLRREFGERVASLVAEESDAFTEGVSEEDSWHDRKQAAIDRLAAASRDAKIVALGDKLSNARAIYRDWMVIGDRIWDIFHVKDKASHKWHYEGLVESLSELSDTFAYKEFAYLVKTIFS